MAAALERHDRIVRTIVDDHDGYVFATGGDGFAVAFTTASSAADAAVDIQRRLQDQITDPPIAVRMGLHTGEALERGNNYFGTEVNRAARLMSIAAGGQVLVSDATEALLRDQAVLRPLGEHRLRGLAGRTAVHQLMANGLATDFPALGGLGSLAGNLPEDRSTFVGRGPLLSEVAELVRTNNLVTLSGVGGVGKTRLALEVAGEMAGEFPDGVWYVELAPVADPSSVPAAIATTLGVTPKGDVGLIDVVAEAVSGRTLLLVVDNCEHLASAAAGAIDTILSAPGPARILATSRQHLSVGGERLVNVRPLSLDGGPSSDATALFAERARTVRPGFALDDADTAEAVAEICETLDGLPLGIELAAARMASMSAVEVRDRLGDRFRLLQGAHDAPDRHETLDHAVGWSYDLLTDDEQELLRAASVCSGGFDVDTVTIVVDADDGLDVLARLDSLVRRSLVVADHSSHRTRYSLFETIRQFAEERLAETGGLQASRDRHAAHFARETVARWEHWNGPEWRTAVDWVALELDNLRSAFRWATARDDLDVAVDIAAHAALMGFSIELFETLAWAEELLDAATAADVARLPRLYAGAGYACFAGRAQAAAANAHRASELEHQPGYDPCEPGYGAFIEALGEVYSGNLGRYVELTERVAALPGPSQAYAIAAYMNGLESAGRVDEALALVDDAVAAAYRLANPYWIAYTLWIVGLTYSKVDSERALRAWDQALEVVAEDRVNFFDVFLSRDTARLHTSHGRPRAALGLFDHAIESAHRAGAIPQLVITLASVPELFERLDLHDEAATLFGALSELPGSFHHVPELADLGDRLASRLPGGRWDELTEAGRAMDLNDAVVYTREQIDLARRTPDRDQQPAPPGGLTPRELDVLRLIAAGRTTRQVAEQLFISFKTADHHIEHIYTKIAVSNRAAATRWAVDHDVLEPATAS